MSTAGSGAQRRGAAWFGGAIRALSVLALGVSLAFVGVPAPPAQAADPPLNDSIENAVVITDPLPFSFEQSGFADATADALDPSSGACYFPPTPPSTVWARYTPAADVSVRASLSSSGSIDLYSGSPGSLSSVACLYAGHAPVALAAGTDYFLMFTSPWGTPTDPFTVTLAEVVPPANDSIENAVVITDPLPGSFVQAGFADATADPSDPAIRLCGGPSTLPTVWARYTPTADVLVRASFSSSGSIDLYSGSPGSLTTVACLYAGHAPVALSAGTEYFLMFTSPWGMPADPFTVTLSPVIPPANDVIENAVVLTDPLPSSFMQPGLADATADASDPAFPPCGYSGATVWAQYTPGADVSVRLAASASASFNVYSGSPGELTRLGCAGGQPLPLSAGVDYYFMITQGWSMPTAPFTVTLSEVIPPANDAIENAVVIPSVPFSFEQTGLRNAARSASDPFVPCPLGQANTWARYTPNADETVRVQASEGLGLVLYSGPLDSLTPLGCLVGPVKLDSGVDYYVMIAQDWTATADGGRISLEVVSPPANDELESATEVSSLPFSLDRDETGASGSADDPQESCTWGGIPPTVWFHYRSAAEGKVRVAASPGVPDVTQGMGLVVSVFSGSPEALVFESCGQWSTTFGTHEEVDYWLVVSAHGGQIGHMALTVEDAMQSTSLTAAPATVTYGATATLQATLSTATGPVAYRLVEFRVNGDYAGTTWTDWQGVATAYGLGLGGLNAGHHRGAITATFVGDSDYRGSTASADLVVEPAPLTVTAPSHSMVVGAPLPAWEAEYEGLANGDTSATAGLGVIVSVSPQPVSTTVPGVYTVTASGITNPNYVPSYVDGALTTQYGVKPLFDPAKVFTGRAVPLTVALVDANGRNLSSSTITLTAVELQGPEGTYPPKAVGGSAKQNAFTYDRKLVKGGGYQYNLEAAGLPAGSYTLVFRVSSDPPDVLESVAFTIR